MRVFALALLLNLAWAKPITLDVHQADVRQVLRLIANEAGLNLVIADGVQGRVTLTLTQVDHEVALKTVAAAVGAAIQIEGQTGMVR